MHHVDRAAPLTAAALGLVSEFQLFPRMLLSGFVFQYVDHMRASICENRPWLGDRSAFDAIIQQVAAEGLGNKTTPGPGVRHVRIGNAITIGVGLSRTPLGNVASHAAETNGDVVSQTAAIREALRAFEQRLAEGPMPAAEARRLRRLVAAVVHPDLHCGDAKGVADSVMKRVNAVIAESLQSA